MASDIAAAGRAPLERRGFQQAGRHSHLKPHPIQEPRRQPAADIPGGLDETRPPAARFLLFGGRAASRRTARRCVAAFQVPLQEGICQYRGAEPQQKERASLASDLDHFIEHFHREPESGGQQFLVELGQDAGGAETAAHPAVRR